MLLGTSFNEAEPTLDLSEKPYTIASSHAAFKIDSIVDKTFLDFELPDRFVRICSQHALKPRGHCLLWHCRLPRWIAESKNIESILKNYIQATVSRYPQVEAWDVVNEFFADNGELRPTPLAPYLEKAFHWAHEANPQAQLLCNDYRPMLQDKWNAILGWCDRARNRGVPIHGIGVQHHHHVRKILAESVLGWQQSKKIARRIISRGLVCEFTEVSIVGDGVPASDKLTRNFYRSLENIAQNEGVHSFTYWRGPLHHYRP